MGKPKFPTTDWRQVRDAADFTTPRGDAALAGIVVEYSPPMRWYLRHDERLGEEESEEVLQAFVTAKLVDPVLLSKADRERGRFRSLLLTSLRNFVKTRQRRQQREPLAAAISESPADDTDQLSAFASSWARSIIGEALDATRRELEAGGRGGHWQLFDARVVRPALEGVRAAKYSACGAIDLGTVCEASNALATAKRCFARCLVRLAGEKGDGKPLACELLKIFSTGGARNLRLARTGGHGDVVG